MVPHHGGVALRLCPAVNQNCQAEHGSGPREAIAAKLTRNTAKHGRSDSLRHSSEEDPLWKTRRRSVTYLSPDAKNAFEERCTDLVKEKAVCVCRGEKGSSTAGLSAS